MRPDPVVTLFAQKDRLSAEWPDSDPAGIAARIEVLHQIYNRILYQRSSTTAGILAKLQSGLAALEGQGTEAWGLSLLRSAIEDLEERPLRDAVLEVGAEKDESRRKTSSAANRRRAGEDRGGERQDRKSSGS